MAANINDNEILSHIIALKESTARVEASVQFLRSELLDTENRGRVGMLEDRVAVLENTDARRQGRIAVYSIFGVGLGAFIDATMRWLFH